MEPPLKFSARLTSNPNPGSTLDEMEGVLDPRKKYFANLTIPFQTGENDSDERTLLDYWNLYLNKDGGKKIQKL